MEASILTIKTDIIIKCSLEEMVKCFFKDYVVVWHDPDINSQENQKYMVHFVERFCEIKTFTEWEQASIYIRETRRICHVVTSGADGELLVREICSHGNIFSIYVFCRNRDYHLSWTKNYPKIACVETEISDVFDKIQQELLEWYKRESSLKLNLPAFAPIFNDTHKSQMNHLHRFLKVIPNFKNREQAKHDFIALSREIYSDRTNTKLIVNFEKNYNEYNMEKVLKWYTDESFLYKVTNNCLRIATSDSIQYCRLPLRDMQKAIKEQYQMKSKHFNGLLYRAAPLGKKEWQILKENVGQEIEMHGFLSTSKEKDVALKYMNIDSIGRVFITILVPKGPNEEEQGFAEIEDFSKYPLEKEVLFNVRSRFTVLEAEEKSSEELPLRHLVLLYGAQGFRRFIAEKSPVQEVLIPENISCTQCKAPSFDINEEIMFVPITNHGNNEYYCKRCLLHLIQLDVPPLLSTPLISYRRTNSCKIDIKGFELMKKDSQILFYGYQCAKCQLKKEKIYLRCTNCDQKQNTWCGDCFENISDCINLGHIVILESSPFSFWWEQMSKTDLNHLSVQNDSAFEGDLFQQAQMFSESHEYEKAIEYYKAYIDQNEMNEGESKLAICYSNIGQGYSEQGEYKKALEYCVKSLDVIKSAGQDNHPDAAIYYENLAKVYLEQEEFQKALDNHLKSLEIKKTVYGENHWKVADSYNYIGLVYADQGKYKKAIEYYLKSLNIQKLENRENHPDSAASYNNIGLVYNKQGEYQKALECCLKALEMTKSVHGEKHPNIADFCNNIGTIYHDKGEYKKAIEYYLKALDITKSICGEKHPDVAISYNNLGVIYNDQGEEKKALEYYFKSLKIQKSVHGDHHHTVATSYNNIGVVYEKQGDGKNALQYYLESLDILKSVYEHNHPDIATSYTNIGLVYSKQKKYRKALEYHLKSLEIRKLVYGEQHYRVADSYYNIGVIYDNQREFEKAMQYYLKTLAIRTSIYIENHPKIMQVQNHIDLILMIGQIKQ